MIYKNKLHLLLLAFVIILGFAVRLYRFDNPIADWHSWRQADTSAVSRNFVQHGYDLLHPRFDDLSNIPSGKDNPQGYRFVEFPIYNVAQAGLFQFFGIFTLEEWGRLVSIGASLVSAVFLYLLVSRHSKKSIGLLTTFFYLFIPYNIYYGRTILPDTSMVMAILGGIYFLDLWIEKSEKFKVKSSRLEHPNQSYLYLALAIVFTAGACLLKPYALFFTLPMLYVAWKRWGLGLFKQWQLWVFVIISVLPLILWRIWMTQYPEGIPANAWLLNGNGIRFRPAFFRWIFYERLTVLISGYFGVVLLILGAIVLKKVKEWGFFLSFLMSSLLYVFVFATGNVQHDYYQILIMPTISMLYALGSYYLYQWSFKKLPLGKAILVICLIGHFIFAWNIVKDYFNINNRSIVVAGEAVDKLVPKDAKVIANLTGDTSFLYQTNRNGWPSFEKDLPEMITMGADYLILANPTEQDMGFAKTYKVVKHTPQYVIFDLHKTP